MWYIACQELFRYVVHDCSLKTGEMHDVILLFCFKIQAIIEDMYAHLQLPKDEIF